MAVFRYLDASTAYVRKEDCDKLEREGRNGTFVVLLRNSEYGWFIHVPYDDSYHEVIKKMKAAGYSNAFMNLIRYARKKKCYWLNLDRDGEQDIDDLPTFEW